MVLSNSELSAPSISSPPTAPLQPSANDIAALIKALDADIARVLNDHEQARAKYGATSPTFHGLSRRYSSEYVVLFKKRQAWQGVLDALPVLPIAVNNFSTRPAVAGQTGAL